MIIVDDGSTDHTLEIANNYARLDSRIKVVHQENKGLAGARNAGIANSDPNRAYVTWLDSDDTWEADALEKLLNALKAQPNASGSYGLARYIDEHSKISKTGELETTYRSRKGLSKGKLVDWPIDSPTTYDVLVCWDCIPASAGIVRRSSLMKTNLFDPSFPGCEDWDIWITLSLQGYFIMVDSVVLNYRIHDNNMSGNSRKLQIMENRVRRKLLSRKDSSIEQKNIARIAWSRAHKAGVTKRFRWMKENLLGRKYFNALIELKYIITGMVKYYYNRYILHN